jgi:hypothetical protein
MITSEGYFYCHDFTLRCWNAAMQSGNESVLLRHRYLLRAWHAQTQPEPREFRGPPK